MRFSKAKVSETITARIDEIANRFDLNPGVGWVQVEGCEIEKIVAYGEMDGLMRLADELGVEY